jgi:hypothetical protein
MSGAASAVGMGLGGVGDLVSSFSGGGGTASLSPEAQWELANLGLNNQNYQVGLQGLQSFLGPQAQQSAFGDIFGTAQGAAGQYATNAYSGQLTPGAQQQITNLGQSTGGQGAQAKNQIIQQALQSGQTVDSPSVQYALSQVPMQVQSAYTQGMGQIASADYQNSVANANQAIATGASGFNRIAGGNVPGSPNPATLSGNTPYTGASSGGQQPGSPNISAYLKTGPGGYQTPDWQKIANLGGFG